MAHQNHYTGLKPDDLDSNAKIRQYGVDKIPTHEHPTVDLREYINHVSDQGKLCSCTANVVCAAYELVLKRGADLSKLSASNFRCSRLFVYYNTRNIQKNTGEDTGASLGNTFRAIHNIGVCRESLWPYDVLKFSQKPSDDSYKGAKGNTIIQYERLGQHMQQFRACLKDGFPIAFGFKVYESFRNLENDRTGMMLMPSKEEVESDPSPEEMQAALAVGYNDDIKCVTVLNSWGESFGDKGYFYMPYEYISDSVLAFDFWMIVEVSEKVTSLKPTPTTSMEWFSRIT